MDYKKEVKELQTLARYLRALETTKKPLNDFQIVGRLQKAISAAKKIALEPLITSLDEEENRLKKRINHALEERRELLLKTAKNDDVPHKRFGEYDRIRPFKILYKGKKVQLELGSEPVCQFEETDGQKLYDLIHKKLEELEGTPFSREAFFSTIKDAYYLACSRKEDQNSWVAVTKLYLYVTLLRHLHFADFLKKPNSKKFRDYSTAQFVYDLARFGKYGWSFGKEALRTRTPNMASVAAKKTMALPELESVNTLGPQFAVLKVEKKISNAILSDTSETR